MKTPSINSLAHRALAHVPGRSHRKQANPGESSKAPSSAASSDIASLRLSRSDSTNEEGAPSVRRNAQLPGTPGASVPGTPSLSFRSDEAVSPGSPGQTPSTQDVLRLADEVVGQIEADHGPLPPLPATPGRVPPAEPESHGTVREPLDAVAHMFASFAGTLELRPSDTGDHLTRLRQMFAAFTEVPAVQVPSAAGHGAHARQRAEYFDAMASLITRLAARDRIVLSSADRHQLGELTRFSAELGRCAADNPFSGQHAHRRHVNRIAASETNARSALESLLHEHLPTVLPEIMDPDMLAQLANDLIRQHEGHPARRAAPAKAADGNGWRELVASIRKDIDLATAEVDLQRKLLAHLGSAVLELGEAQIDGLHGGLNHRARQILPVQVAKKSGIDPRPRAGKVRDAIDLHLGAHFDVEVSKEHKDKLDMSVKQWAIGRITIADLEAQLSELLQLKTPKFIPAAIRAAVVKAPDFELTRKDGRARVSLTEPAQQRLNALRLDTLDGPHTRPAEPTPEVPAPRGALHALMAEFQSHIDQLAMHHGHHGSDRHQEALAHANNTLHALAHLADMPPQQRLANAATRAVKTSQLGVLKLSLVKSFGDQITHHHVNDAIDQTLSLLHPHPGLAHEKAELLLDTWSKVLSSHSAKEMLTHITSAEQSHEAIWRERDRPHGGRTAELLEDLRSAVERFGEGF